ncbi:MAG: response regulator [Phycisphaerae bacterium]|nr:response regulator [Phycisphaerae bacterium]
MVSNRIDPLQFKNQPAAEPEVQADILVVDDDLDLADFLGRRALEYFDKAVLLAGSLEEANAALDDHKPKIVLVDMLLPDGDGTDLLLRLQRDDVPAVAVVTGAPSLYRATVAMHARAVDFITKPFTEEQVTGAFERLARRLAEHEEVERLRLHAAVADEANQQLRMKVDILCKDLVHGYQTLVTRMAGN